MSPPPVSTTFSVIPFAAVLRCPSGGPLSQYAGLLPPSPWQNAKALVVDEEKGITRTSFGLIGLSSGLVLLVYGFGAYFQVWQAPSNGGGDADLVIPHNSFIILGNVFCFMNFFLLYLDRLFPFFVVVIKIEQQTRHTILDCIILHKNV